MSLTWSAPQTSRLRAWLEERFSPPAARSRTPASRAAVDPRENILPGLPLHPGLSATSHLAPHLRDGTSNWRSYAYDTDAPKKVLVVPGAALGRSHRDHIRDIGLWPQEVAALNTARHLLEKDPEGWLAVIVDADIIKRTTGGQTAVDSLRRSRPDLPFIFVSAGQEQDADASSTNMTLTRPFSLQQLEVALGNPEWE